MNDDELRRALDSYATAAPAGDPRPGLAARLARRRRVRTASVAGIACLAAAVAGGGVAALSRDDGRGVIVAADPTPTPTPRVAALSPAAAPSPTPSPSGPNVTHTGAYPEPAPPTATASTTAPPPSPSPTEEPTAPVTASANGAHGLRLRVTLDPGNPATATEAVLTVEASDDDGYVHVSAVEWGDGTEESIGIPVAACAPRPASPSPRQPAPSSRTVAFRHAWRHATPAQVVVRAVSLHPCDPAEPPEDAAEARVRADVQPGRVTTNGPAAPGSGDVDVVAVDQARREYRLSTFLDDRDGWIGGAVVDWGDGTTTRLGPAEECADGGGRHYPSQAGFGVEETHAYAEPGSYTVTVTYASTGCGGRDAQRRVLHTTAEVAGPPGPLS